MFTEPDTHIFGPFWNGQAQAWADPLEVYYDLRALLEDPDRVMEQARERRPVSISAEGVPSTETIPNIPVQTAARKKLHDATLAAFHLSRFDPATGKGVTRQQSEQLYESFLEFLQKKRNQDDASPPSSPVSAGPPTGQP